MHQIYFICLGVFKYKPTIFLLEALYSAHSLLSPSINRASFCCTKKLHLFLTKVAKLHLCTNISNDNDLLQRFIYT